MPFTLEMPKKSLKVTQKVSSDIEFNQQQISSQKDPNPYGIKPEFQERLHSGKGEQLEKLNLKL
jgi:hypothetical protein